MQRRIEHVIFVHICDHETRRALSAEQVCEAVTKFNRQALFDKFIQILLRDAGQI